MQDGNSDKKCSKGIKRIFIVEDEVKETELDGNEKEFSFAIDVEERNKINLNSDVGVTKRRSKRVQMFHDKTTTDASKDNEDGVRNCTSLTSAFFKKSSIYALNQIGNSNTTRRKIFWAFILIGGIIGCCSQVIRYLTAYYAYPVVINIDSVNMFNQDFPGVTICNLNSVRNDFFPCVLQKLEHGECNTSTTQKPINLAEAVGWTQPDCFRQAVPKLSEEFQERMQFASLYFSLTEDSRINFGHQAEDFIKSCSFNGEDCSYSDFFVRSDDIYGNCFTFNKVNTSKVPLKTSYIGPNSGLTLELDVETQDYIWLSQSVGARVVVHDPYQEPSPQDTGLNVSPGFETTLGLSKVLMRRLESPYKDQCRKYGKGDSKRRCDAICNEKKISLRCECSLPSATHSHQQRTCDFSNAEDLCCQHLRSEEANITCACPLDCESSDYEIKISSGVWPARVYNLGSDEYAHMPLEDVRSTVLKLKVYFDTLECLTYEQKPMFEDSEVLSQIGGQMGLWLGLSLAALFECLENMVLFLKHYRNKNVIESYD